MISSSSRTGTAYRGSGAERLRERLEALEVVARQEDVDARERGRHPARERLVAGRALQGVRPDHPVREAAEPRHLGPQHRRIPPLEAVGAQHDDGAAERGALAPPVEERLQRLTDPGAALPVLDERPDLAHRPVWVLRPERPRDPGEPCPEAED